MNCRSRKKQIEKDFLPQLSIALKKAGCPINREGRALIKAELRSAAMVGAAEERWRTLNIVGRDNAVAGEIVKQGVLTILGYDE